MHKITIPDSRLLSAIPYLTKGGRAVDVGTDHAYLPIYLVQEGLISHALACDINAGPLRSARTNIAAAGLTNRIGTLRTDGLHGVESYAPDDVMIFGMGGE
ncbi:MAG: SAM-dependent methyltransferase, partial [Clostridia bacterium]|nr:SAM-dependent methyltransferase [Clostridia bacterium]